MSRELESLLWIRWGFSRRFQTWKNHGGPEALSLGSQPGVMHQGHISLQFLVTAGLFQGKQWKFMEIHPEWWIIWILNWNSWQIERCGHIIHESFKHPSLSISFLANMRHISSSSIRIIPLHPTPYHHFCWWNPHVQRLTPTATSSMSRPQWSWPPWGRRKRCSPRRCPGAEPGTARDGDVKWGNHREPPRFPKNPYIIRISKD